MQTLWSTGELYPNIRQAALSLLAVYASSAPSERVFSKAGIIVSERRSLISSKNLNYMIFLNENKDFNDD